MPFESPLIVIGLAAPVAERLEDPAAQVPVYPEIAAPPSEDGATKLNVAVPSPTVPTSPVGAPGTVAEGAEEEPVAFVLPPPPPPPHDAKSRHPLSKPIRINDPDIEISR